MKYEKNSTGQYVIKGHTYEQLVGSRAQVKHRTAYKTSGGLTYEDLYQNKHGRIVSLSKHRTGLNKNKNNLLLKGYTAKKGKFGYVKVGGTHRRGHRGTHSRKYKAKGGSSGSAVASGTSAAPIALASSGPVASGTSGTSGVQPYDAPGGVAAGASEFSGSTTSSGANVMKGGKGKTRKNKKSKKQRGGYALTPANF